MTVLLVHTTRRISHGSQDLIKRIILLCIIVTVSLTVNTLPHLERMLDGINDTALADILRGGSVVAPKPKGRNCFIHPPMQVDFEHVEDKNESFAVLQLPTPEICGRLRRDWGDNGRHHVPSDLAREFEAHQSNCSLPVSNFVMDNSYGLGSHLVLWSQALCNAMEQGYRVRTVNPDWLWMDRMYCNPQVATWSPLLCYFPRAELRCENMQDAVLMTKNISQNYNNRTLDDPRNRKQFCSRLRENYNNETLRAFRSASMEYLFQSLSPLIIKEAERQVGLLFPGGIAPPDLISVHIRWGDKFWEMDLAPIEEYIKAVQQILERRNRTENQSVSIYLASEDPQAVEGFLKAAPANWQVYVDRTYTELTPYRPPKGNRASWVARNTKGRAGLVALGSLLVAMEANDFVLTTGSNWSRLMDALRKNMIDVQCGNCTTAIDLRPGIW